MKKVRTTQRWIQFFDACAIAFVIAAAATIAFIVFAAFRHQFPNRPALVLAAFLLAAIVSWTASNLIAWITPPRPHSESEPPSGDP
ncbi:hypothetical protein HNR46_002200 [Haloferula luteola]|uniref:Uncharacterized protein n=1 Tax=Haloferula luteola TaxID=595692 RepID=A0A840VGQ2_9BACT|nr:hypothetical protein [Haloferula luteola]MBB5351961.1 hypothetical protein [Haloferula luteola]